MRWAKMLWLLPLAGALLGCAPIDESQRLIEVTPPTVQRAVLLEDFTGQRCVNCPEANQTAHELQADYGTDKVVVVAHHSAPYGLWPSREQVGLRTALADRYAQHWKVEMQPSGLVNRRGGLLNRFAWRTAVHEALQQPTPLRIALRTTRGGQGEGTSVQVELHSSAALQGKLQVWIVENDIVAPQILPSGFRADYVHQHVLRAAVNGDWGEHVTLKANSSSTHSYPLMLDSTWQKPHLQLVAFVYDEEGVQQVATTPLIVHP